MTLAALLDAGARFDAEYAGGLTNHRPMALVALAALGADEARLAAFAARYESRLQPMPPEEPWPGGDPWPGRLGDARAWPAYRSLFRDWLAHEGAAMLPQVLPALLRGCGAAAFHGLIRTAYGLRAGHAGEIADGLAYWACRWLPLGAPDGTPPAGEPLLIWQRMQQAAARRGFEAAAARIAVDAGTVERLARESARLYAASGDFTALHLVTGCHALRVVLAHVDEPLAALPAFRRAWLAARRASAAREGDMPAPRPWDEIVAAARASDDDHAIKLVDSARAEAAHYGGDEWQRAATRAVFGEPVNS